MAISNYQTHVYATSSAWDQRGNSTDKLDSLGGKTLVRKIQDAWIEWHNACSASLALDNATLVGGTGYPDGIYTDVELTAQYLLGFGTTQYAGREIYATVTVASGAVTAVTLTQKGGGFIDGETLIFVDDALDGSTAGSGFSIDVAAGSNVQNRPINCGDAKRVARDGSWTNTLGWSLGARRDNVYADCRQSSFMGWAGNETSTFYHYTTIDMGRSRNNNGIWVGTSYSTGDNGSIIATFSDSTPYIIYIFWCADEGKECFLISDTQYRDVFGWIRLDSAYASCHEQYSGDWFLFSDRSAFPMMNVNTSSFPYDWTTFTIFTEMGLNGAIKPFRPCETDNFVAGYVDPDIGKTAFSGTVNQTLQAFDGSVWTQVFPRVSIKTTDATP